MQNMDLNLRGVEQITRGDINRGTGMLSEHPYWVELHIKLSNGDTLDLTCWANEQDKLIIQKEQ